MTDCILYRLKHYINAGHSDNGLPWQEIHHGTLFECLDKAKDYCGGDMPVARAVQHGISIERSKL